MFLAWLCKNVTSMVQVYYKVTKYIFKYRDSMLKAQFEYT